MICLRFLPDRATHELYLQGLEAYLLNVARNPRAFEMAVEKRRDLRFGDMPVEVDMPWLGVDNPKKPQTIPNPMAIMPRRRWPLYELPSGLAVEFSSLTRSSPGRWLSACPWWAKLPEPDCHGEDSNTPSSSSCGLCCWRLTKPNMRHAK